MAPKPSARGNRSEGVSARKHRGLLRPPAQSSYTLRSAAERAKSREARHERNSSGAIVTQLSYA